jgi:outer membrane protein
MKRMAILLLAMGILAAHSALAQTPRSLSLAEAVAMAQKNAVTMVRAEGQTRTAAAGVRSAMGAFLPSLSVSAGASRQLGATGTTRVENGQVITVAPEPWSSSLGLGANVNLFDGGQRFFELSQARATSKSAQVGEESARWQVALSAKQAFFDVLAASEIQTAATAQLQQANQQRVAAIARTRAKTATRSDSLRAENLLRSAQLAVLQANTTRASAEAALARTIGSSEPVTAAETTPIESASLAASDEALVGLLGNAPSVRAANTDLIAAQAGKKVSWTGYLPSVSASWSRAGSGTGATPEWSADALNYAGSLRLALSFPLFDQFGREARTTQSDVAVKNAEAELRDARLAAHQSLTAGLGAFSTAAQQIVSQTASVEAAEEDLRVQRQRYAVGGSTLLDVLTSQTQLDQARRDLIRARYDQRVAKAQLEALVGREL